MNVLYISRSTLFTSPGGDTKQIELTAHYLRKLGISVDIKLSHEIIDYTPYDLLHFFNIIRPADILFHARASQKPFVTSTIFLDYGEFEKKFRKGWMGLLNTFFSEDTIEYIKVIARFLKNGEKIRSKSYLIKGHKSSVRYLIENSKVLLPNSRNEFERLVRKYKLTNDFIVVPNAIDPLMYHQTTKSLPEFENKIVCVARVEGRKNQLNLVRALRNTKYELVIVGLPSPNNLDYYEQCRAEATDNITFIRRVSEEELYQIYNSAKVHVLPSFFETTGLSTLEAAVMGCNIVITDKGDTEEYFKDKAYYCDPDSPDSIRKAIELAYNAPFDNSLREMILEQYTWEKAAFKTLEGYRLALTK